MKNATTAIATLILTIISVAATRTLSQVVFTAGGATYELTRFRAGRVELYVHQDGLASFVGYLDDVATHIPAAEWRAIEAGLEALRAAHEGFWSAYLPGADSWTHEARA